MKLLEMSDIWDKDSAYNNRITLSKSSKYDELYYYNTNNNNGTSSGSQGGFFLINFTYKSVYQAHGCREVINNSWNKSIQLKDTNSTSHMGFTAANLNVAKITEFFKKVELALGERAKVEIILTNDSKIIIFKPSNFWLSSQFRQGMFTLFVRAACIYYNGDFDRSFINYQLAYSIKPVIDYFLEGYVDEIGACEFQLDCARGLVFCYSKYNTREMLEKKLQKMN